MRTTATPYHFQHPVPLPAVQIHAGRIVAARMQHQHAVARQGGKKGQHFVKFQPACRRVVIRVNADFETRALENAFMIVPSRIADIHLGIGKPAGKEIRTDFQRARISLFSSSLLIALTSRFVRHEG